MYRVYVKQSNKRRVRAYSDEFSRRMLMAESDEQAEKEVMRLLDQCALFNQYGSVLYPEEVEAVILEYGFSYREPIKIVI